MSISALFSYLVPPGKGVDPLPSIYGTPINQTGRLFELLVNIYNDADFECNIPIMFSKSEEGKQENVVHDLIVSFSSEPSLKKGKPIAERLCGFTTNKPKLGLLFLMVGKNNRGDDKLIISRFPAEQGILADLDNENLNVEFIERIFMKSSKLYKAALYHGTNIKQHFWNGFAIDKQINSSTNELAQYWIHDFLLSDYKITSKEGSLWLGAALKDATYSDIPIHVKQELISFGTLLKGMNNKTDSVMGLLNKYNISDESKNILLDQLPDPELADLPFEFNFEEFLKKVSFTSVEMENQGIMLAPSPIFDTCFVKEEIGNGDGKVRFITEGKIKDQKYRGRK